MSFLCSDWLELFSGTVTGAHLGLYLPSVSLSQRKHLLPDATPSIAELLWSAPCGTGSSVLSALSCKCHLTWLRPPCCSKPTLVFYLQSVSSPDSEWGEYAQFTDPNDKRVVLEVSFFVNEAECLWRISDGSRTSSNYTRCNFICPRRVQ